MYKKLSYLIKYSIVLLGLLVLNQHLFAEYDLLNSEDPAVRREEAKRLGNDMVREAVPELIGLLTDDSIGVRLNTVVSLGRLRDEMSIEPLMDLIEKDENITVRTMAIQTLSRFRNEQVITFILDLLDNENERIRGAAARALGRIGGEKEVEKLIQRADKDDSAEVRWSAVGALTALTERGNAGGKRTDIEKAIKKSKKDKSEKVKESAQEGLEKLEKVPGRGRVNE